MSYFWKCSCGGINHVSFDVCQKCGKPRKEVKQSQQMEFDFTPKEKNHEPSKH